MCLSVWQVLRCACVPVFTGLQVLGVCCAGCHCVRLSVGVCACLCACGALWVSVLCLWCALLRCLCAVWQVLPCVVLWVSAGAALWSALMRCAVVLGCAFINKNKGLQRFLNEID